MVEKTFFVIGPIGDPASEERKHADWILEGIVNPALEALGLPQAVRADKITIPGMIDGQVINHVLDADLVIADLSLRNVNAFYELGLRHREAKPIIHLVHKSESKQLPFDVAPYRTVFVSWDAPVDVRQSILDLKAQIEAATASEHVVENPVTRARGQQHLRDTGTPAEKLLLEEVQRLSSRITELERDMVTSNFITNSLEGREQSPNLLRNIAFNSPNYKELIETYLATQNDKKLIELENMKRVTEAFSQFSGTEFKLSTLEEKPPEGNGTK